MEPETRENIIAEANSARTIGGTTCIGYKDLKLWLRDDYKRELHVVFTFGKVSLISVPLKQHDL